MSHSTHYRSFQRHLPDQSRYRCKKSLGKTNITTTKGQHKKNLNINYWKLLTYLTYAKLNLIKQNNCLHRVLCQSARKWIGHILQLLGATRGRQFQNRPETAHRQCTLKLGQINTTATTIWTKAQMPLCYSPGDSTLQLSRWVLHYAKFARSIKGYYVRWHHHKVWDVTVWFHIQLDMS